MVIANNKLIRFRRMGVETGFSSRIFNFHVDRNNLSQINITERIALSIVGRIDSGSISHNQISDQYAGIEMGGSSVYNVTVANNVLTNVTWGISVATSRGSVIENNIFNNVTNPISENGGYDNTTWVGQNSYNGALIPGWVGPGNLPHGPYLQKPITFAPWVP